jgi:aryl-alcohol dehydrogenase-like predicted oxidoreductase
MATKLAAHLPLRTLGRGGPELSVLGVGSWAIGGGGWMYGWGRQDDEDAVAALVHAIDRGVNWIDTAAVYGLGHSEEIVGQAILRIPTQDRPLVFTKCGLRWTQDHRAAPNNNLRPESIRQECEDSLRRLGVERIDLYQFHWPDPSGVQVEDSWGEMSRLVAQGKVRAAGVSNFDVALLKRCEPIMHVASLQPPFSLILRNAAAELLPWCRSNGTGVIVYSPMQMGLLTDGFTRDRLAALDAEDWRLQTTEFKEPGFSQNLALRDALRPTAERHDSTVAAVALSWVLTWEGVTGAIVGARAPRQVDGWIGGATLTLTPADLDEIASAISTTGAGSGPNRPT